LQKGLEPMQEQIPKEPLFIPIEHLAPHVQGALDAARIIRKGRLLRTANAAGFAGILGAGGAMALGAFNGDIITGGATIAFGTYFARKFRVFESAHRSLKAMGIHKANVLADMQEKVPVAKPFVEKYGLSADPKETWKRLSEKYCSFVLAKSGITFYPKTAKYRIASALNAGKKMG